MKRSLEGSLQSGNSLAEPRAVTRFKFLQTSQAFKEANLSRPGHVHVPRQPREDVSLQVTCPCRDLVVVVVVVVILNASSL